MISTTITSKGKAQENMGKERETHLSAFIPINMESPTEATTCEDKLAYRYSSRRLLAARFLLESPELSGGEFNIFYLSLYLLGGFARSSSADGACHMAFPIKISGRFDL